MEDTKKLIEKYKRELMELSKAAPRPAESSQETHGAHGTQGVHESSVSSEATETFPSPEAPETADMPAAPETSSAPEATAETPKAPKIIGYVTEESGEFPAVFDRFITEAVENNDIETIRTAPSDTNDETDAELTEEIPDVPADETTDNAPSTAPPTVPPTEQTADDMSEAPDNAPAAASDFDAMNDMAQGTGESISDFPVSEYATVEEFEAGNRGGGSLEFRVFTAREAMPIENASIVVSARINGDDREMFSARTNSSGETDAKTLPAPLKSLSQNSENTVQPFSLYDASVEKEGYIRVVLRDIPIFDGIRSIQSVAMIPEFQSENNTEDITEVNDAK